MDGRVMYLNSSMTFSKIHAAGWKAKHESDESVALTVENVLKMN